MKHGLTLLIVLLPALPVRAEDEFWASSQRTAAATAAQVAAVGDPWTAAALRLHAFDRELWDEPPLLPDRVPPLSAHRLGGVRDDKPFLGYQKLLPQEIPADVRDENAVYWQAVRYAAQVPPAVFAQASQPNR